MTAGQFFPQRSDADEGINLGPDGREERKQMYREGGIDYSYLRQHQIADGEPAEHWGVVDDMTRRLIDADSQKRLTAFTLGFRRGDCVFARPNMPAPSADAERYGLEQPFRLAFAIQATCSRSRTDNEKMLDGGSLHMSGRPSNVLGADR